MQNNKFTMRLMYKAELYKKSDLYPTLKINKKANHEY